MLRIPLQCVASLVLGFGIGRWLSGTFDSAKHAPPGVPQLTSGKTSATTSLAPPISSLGRILELGKSGGGLQQDAELLDALKEMRPEDFRAAASLWTAKVQATLQGDEVRAKAILDRWFELDPESARSFAEGVCKPRPQGRSIEGQMFCLILAASAARNDPAWAFDHLLFDGTNPVWYDPNSEIMSEAAQKNPAMAKERLQRMEKSNLYRALVSGYVTGTAKNDPLAAMDLTAEKGVDRINLIPYCAREAASKGRGMALEALAKITDSNLRRQAAVEAMQVLARETNTSPFPFLEEAIGRDNLAKIDIDSIKGSDAMVADPRGAADWAASLPEQSRRAFLNGILESWQNVDVKAATEWMQQHAGASSGQEELSPASHANDLLASRLFAEGRTTEAMTVLSQTTDLRMGNGILLCNIANEDPEAAAHWAVTMPEGEARECVVAEAADTWVKRDPGAAEKWVEGLPAGKMRNKALDGMINGSFEIDPEGASRWAPLISDPNLRIENITRVFGEWYRIDPEAAREWVRNIPDVDNQWRKRFLRWYP